MIIPAGYVADRLRFTDDVKKLPVACKFLERCFADKGIVKGIICHGAWLMSPISYLVRGRKMVVHNNLLGDAKLMGIEDSRLSILANDHNIGGPANMVHAIYSGGGTAFTAMTEI